MKNTDESSLSVKEKKIKRSENIHEKTSNKMTWTILVVLVIGLISFVVANIATFDLLMSSGEPLPASQCETENEAPFANGVALE